MFKIEFLGFGFWIGILCAFAGSAIFSFFVTAWFTISEREFSPWLFNTLFTILLICWIYSLIPAGICGIVLATVLRHSNQSGTLTAKRAAITGALLSSFTVIVICSVGAQSITGHSIGFLRALWNDLLSTPFSLRLLPYIIYFLKNVFWVWPWILTATAIASSLGGWAGRLLYKRLVGTQGNLTTSVLSHI